MKRHSRAQAGVALIEFALVLPLLILILVGLIDFGRYTFFSILVGNAAHAGAQFGSQNEQNAGNFALIEAVAKADGQNIVNASAQNVCGCWNSATGQGTTPGACGQTCTNGGVGVTYIRVNSSGTFQPLFHYPGLPASFTVSATATMRVL